MTCFSKEANSMVKDCNELVHNMPDKSSYDYPPELLALEGQRKIFQLHFDPQCTKAKQNFILDTCWDEMKLLTAGPAATAATSVELSKNIEAGKHMATATDTTIAMPNREAKHLQPLPTTITTPPEPIPTLETSEHPTNSPNEKHPNQKMKQERKMFAGPFSKKPNMEP